MNAAPGVRTFTLFRNIDWRLLVFLLLFLNVKLVVKITALVLIFLLKPGMRFRFRIRNSRLPLFYPAAIAIAVFNYLVFRGNTDPGYSMVTAGSILFWSLSILAIHQLRGFTEDNPHKITSTLAAFFIINSLVSLVQLLLIIAETGSLNPYQYQGLYQKYFINTGDFIKGVTFDTSTTNAAINAFGIVYFFFQRRFSLVFMCMFTLLLTASNLVNILLFPVLLVLFIFFADRNQKSILVVAAFIMVVFLGKVSPQNNRYLGESLARLTGKAPKTEKVRIPVRDKPRHQLNAEEKKELTALLYQDSVYLSKIAPSDQPVVMGMAEEKPSLPADDIHSEPFQKKDDTTGRLLRLMKFREEKNLKQDYAASRMPGKLQALHQTADYLAENKQLVFTGRGSGNFSSKMAFRATALGIAGGYPASWQYIHDDFLENHLALYLDYFTNREKMHSVIHHPSSVYDQMLGEYGLAGIAALAFLYFGFFLKKYRKLQYGKPLILLLVLLFAFEYWFEQLSIVVLFELMILHDIKENGG